MVRANVISESWIGNACGLRLAVSNAVAAVARVAVRWSLLVGFLVLTANAGAQVCAFTTPPGALVFAPLDPSLATTQTAQATANVRCTASGSPTWQVSGANGSAPLRMKHTTQNFFIPYTIQALFVSPGGGNQRWTIIATILGQDYQNARVGSYQDVLTVTIVP
jgi:spore coat protein U-like protein